MKRFSLFLCLLMVAAALLPGCKTEVPAVTRTDPAPVAQSGQVPEALRTVVAENLFCGATACADRVLKAESVEQEARSVEHRVQMMDLYGNELAQCVLESDDSYHISTLTATEDGGFLFVLGFRDHALSQDIWASDNGYASEICKVDADGVIRFRTVLPQMEGAALEFCFEQEGKFYFFGNLQTPETQTRGTYSPTDIYMTVLDAEGEILDSRTIAGSDFDDLLAAEPTEEGFLLSVRSQSDDGDFTGSNSGGYGVDWVITVNTALEIVKQEKATGRSYQNRSSLGVLNGETVYPDSLLLADYDAGTPTAVLDYGEYYLIVSENATGIYKNTPVFISSIWLYTETVYSGFSPEGELLFRSAVDSSPDFDAMAAEITGN